MTKYLVTVGSVVDLEAGVAYGSRTEAIEALVTDLTDLKSYYEVDGRYPSANEQLQTLELFERAIDLLRRRLERKGEE